MKQEQAERFLGKRLVTFKQVCAELGLRSRMTLYNWLNDERMKFPRPIKLANGKVYFELEEVSKWFASQTQVRVDA